MERREVALRFRPLHAPITSGCTKSSRFSTPKSRRRSHDLDGLAPDADHVLAWATPTRALEGMTCAFSGHRAGDRTDEVVVGPAAAHHVAQPDRVVVPEARVQVARRREAEAVAVVAEVVGHR